MMTTHDAYAVMKALLGVLDLRKFKFMLEGCGAKEALVAEIFAMLCKIKIKKNLLHRNSERTNKTRFSAQETFLGIQKVFRKIARIFFFDFVIENFEVLDFIFFLA